MQRAPVGHQGSEEERQKEQPRALRLIGMRGNNSQDAVADVMARRPGHGAPDGLLLGDHGDVLHEPAHVNRDPDP